MTSRMAYEAATAHKNSLPYGGCDLHADDAAHELGNIRHQCCHRTRNVQTAFLSVLMGAVLSYAIMTRCHGSTTRIGQLPASQPSQRSSGSAFSGLSAPTDEAIDLADNVTKRYFASAKFSIPHFSGRAEKWPSFFCWLLMQSVDDNPMGWDEQKLVKHQLVQGKGIFQCNDWAVMTNEAVALNRWGAHGFPIIPEGQFDPMDDLASWGVGYTQANSATLRVAWSALKESEKISKHDWVVKVDSDAVWFPDRLRKHLKAYLPSHDNGWDSVFLNNCQLYNTMLGPIEVISKKAALQLVTGMGSCAAVDGSIEDQFIVDCMHQLGVNSYTDQTLLNDLYCAGTSHCIDHWRVAFYPHKSVGNFTACYNEAVWAEMNHYPQ